MEASISGTNADRMTDNFAALSGANLPNSFVGNTVQVCVVSYDLMRSIQGFIALGIGPWATYTLSPDTVSDQTYMGHAENFTLRVALANVNGMFWEVIEPIDGPSIHKDFLDAHGEGIHHVAFDCGSLPYEQRIEEFKRRGCNVTQSGVWHGAKFAYLESEGLISTTVEIFDFPEGFLLPEPEQWIPGPPPR